MPLLYIGSLAAGLWRWYLFYILLQY